MSEQKILETPCSLWREENRPGGLFLTTLTTGQLAFCAAKLIGYSNKSAALVAGYSPKTASAAGSRLVKEKKMIALVALIRERARKDIS